MSLPSVGYAPKRRYFSCPFRGATISFYQEEDNECFWRASLPGYSARGVSLSEAIGNAVAGWNSIGSPIVGHWCGPDRTEVTPAEVIAMLPAYSREYYPESFFA